MTGNSVASRIRLNDATVAQLLAKADVDPTVLAQVPVNVGLIARTQRATPITSIKREDLPVDGLLLPNPQGFTISVNRGHSEERQRFSLAHEVAHAILSPRNPAFRNGSKHIRSSERDCESFASMLLMPNPAFTDFVRDYGPSLATITRLANTFKTSIRATAIRFVDVIGQLGVPCILILSQLSCQTSGRRLRVQWAHQNTLKPDGRPEFFIPSNKSVGFKSAYAAFGNDAVHAAREMVELGNLRVRTQTESVAFGRGSNRFVVTLVYPDAKHGTD